MAVTYDQVAVPIAVVADFADPKIGFNTAARAFFGIGDDAARFFIKDHYRMANPDDLERGFGQLADGRPASLPLALKTADGTWVDAILHACPDPPGKSPSVGAVITVESVRAAAGASATAAPPAEAAAPREPAPGTLQPPTQLRVFRDALWASTEIAISVSEDYTTGELLWNRRFYELLGIDPEDEPPSSRAFFECVHPDDRARMVELGTAIVTGEIEEWHDGCRLLTEDGRLRYVRGHGLTAVDEEGRRALVGILIDQTDQQRSAGEAASALADLEQMTASVSHDLRAPVRHLKSFCGLMAESFEGRLSGDDALVFGYAQASIEKLDAMIGAMVEYSRLPKVVAAPVPVDTRALVEALAADKFTRDRARLRIGDLPNVYGDRELLHRLLCHLLDNAVKFSRRHPGSEITVAGERRGSDHAVIAITDRGVGFEPRYADKLFQMFQRLHGGEEFPGFGTGLAIAAQIAQLHGGSIDGESAGGTTTFTVTLPLPPRAPRHAAVGARVAD